MQKPKTGTEEKQKDRDDRQRKTVRQVDTETDRLQDRLSAGQNDSQTDWHQDSWTLGQMNSGTD